MNDIFNQINELKNDDQIWHFIINREFKLGFNSEEKIVGQNYTDSFRDYISKKIHFKPVEWFDDGECPDLIYDDNEPYFNLIKLIKQMNCHDISTLLLLIRVVIHEYFKINSIDSEKDKIIAKYTTYLANKDKSISIKTIRRNGIASCSEISGLVHNFFKFLGIDSEFICGGVKGLDSGPHAYNLVYPNGYGSEPVILNDTTNFFDYTLTKSEYEQFISGVPLTVGEDSSLIYIFGLNNYKNFFEANGQQLK